ncbi:FmdB family zinc ribbon protein [Nesterenkonia populi]|uniref:FmdB family zinc ribbon protein n=1 Tax=Nesterenkonia populi TaxID=1591087 RepID=UPI0011BE395C|nr:FmdB family zinc ribbon protein [Nesterenkonia populi]
MPLYEFRCARCGVFDSHHSMADVPRERGCPQCADRSRRVFTAVGLTRLGSAQAKAIDRAQKSASEPEVVTGAAGRPRATPVTNDPRHQKLPRP